VSQSAPGTPQPRDQPRGQRQNSVKVPLIFSAVLAGVAGMATMIFATGGGTRELRVDLGLTAAGIVFIVSLVFSAMLMMTAKPNPEDLGKGSGVNRSSKDRRNGTGPDSHGSAGA
jgi:hypothetical protein